MNQLQIPLFTTAHKVELLRDEELSAINDELDALQHTIDHGKYGKNLKALAKAMGLYRQHISNIYNGTKYLPIKKWIRFFEACGNLILLQYVLKKMGYRVVSEQTRVVSEEEYQLLQQLRKAG